MTDISKLAAQLRILLQLTQTEAMVAEIRTAQARTDAVRRELTENAKNAEKRTVAIAEDLRRLGGVPDVVTPAIGRVTALVKANVEQAQPFPEALFGDLLLEHQLLDRARYAKVLAEATNEKASQRLADRLIDAHSATVEWLTTVLAEEALGGPAALRPSPVQAAAGGAYRLAILPGRWVQERINKAADKAQRGREQARGQLLQLVGRAVEVSGSAREVVVGSWTQALRRGQSVARREGATGVANKVEKARREAGRLEADELPIPNYDELGAQNAIGAIRELTKPEDVRAIIRFEETHKDRSTVVSAAQTQLARIAKEAVGVSQS